jgi:hypothetical protein
MSFEGCIKRFFSYLDILETIKCGIYYVFGKDYRLDYSLALKEELSDSLFISLNPGFYGRKIYFLIGSYCLMMGFVR